ncbi:MAG: hypothetical protein M1820_005450 [Bogoriella megaspora]|nr:MAG: hypothetical protein M1820_005450 [Bogoriella megaspora]
MHSYEKLQSTAAIRLLKPVRISRPTSQTAKNAISSVFELFEVDLEKKHPEYTCVSYVWGTTVLDKPVSLNDGSVILTSQNAIDIIYQYNTDHYIWIDQICINQADIEERNSQVQLMTRIYSQCTRCDAWLGKDDEYSNDAINLIRELTRAFPDDFRLPQLHGLHTYPLGYVREGLAFNSPPVQLPDLQDPRWPSLAKFLNRPWFSRLWTLQEAARPKQVVFRCGSQNMGFMELHIAACIMGCEHPWNPQNPLTHWQTGTIYKARYELQHRKEKPFRDLVDILSNVQGSSYQCFDPHDRIFAVLGLQRDEVEVPITVDYKLSIPELLIRVTKTVIEQSSLLHILSQKGDSFGPSREGLPGWVPDWDPTIGMRTIEVCDVNFLRFQAGLDRKHLPKVCPGAMGWGELVTTGRICDKATRVFQSDFDEGWNAAKRSVWLTDEMLPALLKVCNTTTDNDRQEATRKIFDTMTRDVFSSEHKVGHNPRWDTSVINDIQKSLAHSQQKVTFGSGTEPDGLPIEFPVKLKEWLRHIASEMPTCLNRRFIALRDHEFGLCPKTVSEGDVIAILHGLSVPAVLRPIADKYRFIGPCFIDGMMYGDACTWNEDATDTLVLL